MTRDLVGFRFARLLVKGRANIRASHGAHWVCLCDCGNQSVVRGNALKSGRIRSCGCLQRERAREVGRAKVVHGYARAGYEHPLFFRWCSMRARCANPNNTAFKYYGAQGVRVCERWNDFGAFLRDVGMPPSPRHTLDRIDPTGNYEPTNVRWATPEVQRANRRTSQVRGG